jgi:trehalose-phosphatase
MAWHYGFADIKYGEWQAAECQNHMTVSLPNFPIHVMARKKCVEVYLRNVSKATSIKRILQHHQNKVRRRTSSALSDLDCFSPKEPPTYEVPASELFDLILCIGDDRCDEYMFQYLRKIMKKNPLSKTTADQLSDLSFADSSHLEFSIGNNRPGSVNMPEKFKVFTVTVGSKSSGAQWHLSSHSEVLATLSAL